VLKRLSLVGLLMMAVGLVALWKVGGLFSPSPAVLAVQALAVALLLWARWTFGFRSFHAAANPTAGGLVTTGPYRFLRHPIYTAVCVFGWAGVAAHPSDLSVLIGVLFTAGAVVRMLCEEKLIVETYPEYREYARRTRRMIPYFF
jgi:protein-S-isoprenylcysteine O-methyltransferase Ste14